MELVELAPRTTIRLVSPLLHHYFNRLVIKGRHVAIFDLFSRRQARLRKGDQPDVYQYDKIPDPLRVQIAQIAIEAIGLVGFDGGRFNGGVIDNEYWQSIEKHFCREMGRHRLGGDNLAGMRVINHMDDCPTEEWLDLLELICRSILLIDQFGTPGFRDKWSVKVDAEEALTEINYRLREASVGFQFEDLSIVRVDSQFLHSEAVKPAIGLLYDAGFEGPRDEFLQAHSHYRAGENRQAVAMAGNAFESTLKAVCDKKKWPYKKGARVSDLLKVVREHGLWPDYLDNSFEQLVATLKSGLPQIRDNAASHGQGSVPKEVPNHIAAYALHLAASKIVFVVEASKAS